MPNAKCKPKDKTLSFSQNYDFWSSHSRRAAALIAAIQYEGEESENESIGGKIINEITRGKKVCGGTVYR